MFHFVIIINTLNWRWCNNSWWIGAIIAYLFVIIDNSIQLAQSLQSLARHSTELYLDEVLQHHINPTVLTEFHICIMSSVSNSSYNYHPKTAPQHTHTHTHTHTQTWCILVEKQRWPVMQREVRWWMTCGWFYRLGKRPRGWLWPVQGPTITSLNKTAWKESRIP